MKVAYWSTLSIFLLLSLTARSQQWAEMMSDPTVNFYAVKADFQEYWSDKDSTERGHGWKIFKRWEAFMAPRLYPHGDRTKMIEAWREYTESSNYRPVGRMTGAGNWTLMGPTTSIPSGGGAGRLNCVVFDPNNSNVIYAGAPAGGLWKSTDGGSTWNVWNTDDLDAIGVSDVAIDPNNSNVIYLATGDRDAGDTYALGLLKSTNGGLTWSTTGLNWTVTQYRRVSRVLIDPTNSNIVLVATSNGIYRSTDAGANFTQTSSVSGLKDMEFNPGDHDILYATSDKFYRSVNNGVTWSQITAGLPAASATNRLAIGVTEANNSYVYVLSSDQSGSGFEGLYRSTDSGLNFTTRSTGPNILGWEDDGSGSGGQGWYDLAIDASPTDADEVTIGGVNIWQSSDGGQNWYILAHWYGANGNPYTHADQHDIKYFPNSGTTIFAANDGGLFKTSNSGNSWSDLSDGLQIGQLYKLGTSATNGNLSISGWQDNGTNLVDGNTWDRIIGGDGMECIIDHSNANIMYGELYYGNIRKSSNGGNSFSTIVSSGGSGVDGSGNWVTPYVMHPTNAQTLIVGKDELYRSTNSGSSWSTLGATAGGSGKFVAIAYAPSDPNYIYAAKNNALFLSTNGGTSFSNVTGTLPVGSAGISYISVSDSDPNDVWVTFTGYSSANKVFQSTNAGTSWTNISSGLPNLPVNCIVYENGTADGIYVGCDVGVYYRDNNLGAWITYFNDLPNVIVSELEIYYGGAGKIRAATFGRGMWESDLFSSATLAPEVHFTADDTVGCPGMVVNFTDHTYFSPTSWNWTFTGGNPGSSTAQNPSVTYNTPGIFPVKLVATNANGTDSLTKVGYIEIKSPGTLPFVEGFEGTQFLPADWDAVNGGSIGVYWERTTLASGYGTSIASATIDNLNNDTRGDTDEMISPLIDLSGIINPRIKFDVAYARYSSTYFEGLEVWISNDCKTGWTQIYSKSGSALATAPDHTNWFIPTNSEWRTDSIDLSAYIGDAVYFRFRNIGGWGNYLYLDNINVVAEVPPIPEADFTVSDSADCPGMCVNFTDQSTENPIGWSWLFPGGNPSSSNIQNPGHICYVNPGTYDVTLIATNVNGSDTITKTDFITVYALPNASAGNDADICIGSSTQLMATGGVSYSWLPSSGLSNTNIANPIASPSNTTIYTVTVMNAQGCLNTDMISIVVDTLPVVSAGQDQDICAGSSIQLQATGSGVSFQWTPSLGLNNANIANPTASPAASVTYTVELIDGNGCNATDDIDITVNALPPVDAGSDTAMCAGDSVQLNAQSASALAYQWSGAGLSNPTVANPLASPAVTTIYTVTVTDANNCTASDQVTVTVNANPIVDAGTDDTLCVGQTVQLQASGAVNYVWSPALILSNNTIPNPVASPVNTTSLTLVGTDGNGCIGVDSMTLLVNPLPSVNAGADVSICEGDTIQLGAVGIGTYNWSPNTGLSNSTIANPVASPPSTQAYTVSLTDSNDCTATDDVTITVLPLPVITAWPDTAICMGESVQLHATGAGSYNWVGFGTDQPIVSPTTTTTYSVVGVDVNGCQGMDDVLITVYPLPSAPTITQNGNLLTANAAPGMTFQWFLNYNPIPNATGSSYTATEDGAYSVVITDANGCKAESTAVTVVTGISTALFGSISVYPNPNDGKFIMELQLSMGGDYEVSIADVLGREIIRQSLALPAGKSSVPYDISRFGKGTYTITMYSYNRAVAHKVIVL